VSEDWIERLGEFAQLADVGPVGPLLLYPDGTIQHAGVVVGMKGWADHVYKGESAIHRASPYVSPLVTRDVLAVTGACMMISRHKFQSIGTFDEQFQICGSDVEFCIRSHTLGHHNLYIPTVKIEHLESKTRSSFVPDVDFKQSAMKYGSFRTKGDPFFNKNLSRDNLSPQPLWPDQD
jgi:GT2 family glycosyltransferase